MDERSNILPVPSRVGRNPYASSFEEAPDLHVNILLQLAMGFTQEQIAESGGHDRKTVRLVQNHPPYRAWLMEQRRLVAEKELAFYDLLRSAQEESAKELLSLVLDPRLKPMEKLNVLKYFNEVLGVNGKQRKAGDAPPRFRVFEAVSSDNASDMQMALESTK
ncbi:MAG: hypothetical protein BWY09_03030 [Candidatus Hydrogenedentes bacterium ADurb.Bin179]|nr:MAG: hypothetical protein BWY09_03030 [Candidatus Hydrogenedentes bacterium ADurb.Bin179]